ncbi:GumC family protein [Brucella pseudogrignonensis]|uniref:Chain-length determining protein n=1 Tax=Brucella pseudogrignonensis TaxID=419475 RepID=A0A256GGA5_9HYPH|nr:GumC family protein [Brucella pseudogrignonensis]EMG53419.1 lipopolysaccharide biosynthesis protein [Ochrobactrum sp. CDB2]MCM0752604.1 chain-length determining protein [Brucella pseudogrignonensis]NNV19015.1 chain-length determining protein [Brucella pseudogrignonensis]OYR26184.1 G-rich domain on tyrosine kinase family protein [Brucella pseudogrignonensis]
MSGDDKRNKGREEKPLLAFSDAPETSREESDASKNESQTIAPPWTPPATPEERAELFRSQQANKAAEEKEVSELRSRMAAIKAELERKIAEREAREKSPKDALPQPSEPVQEAAAGETALPARRDAPDNEWKPLIDPRVAIEVVKGSRRLLLATTLLGGIVATLYALTIPQMFVASTDILVDPRNVRSVGTELTPGQLPTDASLAIAESQARLLDSSSVLLKVIDKADLTKDPEFNGSFVPTGVAGFFAQLKTMFRPKTASDGQALETRVLYNLYDSLTIGRDAKTFIYSISVKTRNAEKSAEIANLIGSVFQTELDSLQSDVARRNADELSKRLSDMRGNVENAEKAAADYRASRDLVDVDGKLISDNDLSRLNDQLTNQRAETMRLQARVQVLSDANTGSVISGTLPEDLRSNTLTALRAQYALASQNANGASTQLGPRHPQFIQLQSQKQTVLNDIDAELRRIRASLQVEVARSVQQEKDLSARLAQLKSQQANSNNDRVKLRELEREATTLRSVYEAFLLRSRETSEQEGITTTNVRVISEARPPLDPAGSTRKLIVIAGLIAGFMLGLAITAVRNFGRLVRIS